MEELDIRGCCSHPMKRGIGDSEKTPRWRQLLRLHRRGDEDPGEQVWSAPTNDEAVWK